MSDTLKEVTKAGQWLLYTRRWLNSATMVPNDKAARWTKCRSAKHLICSVLRSSLWRRHVGPMCPLSVNSFNRKGPPVFVESWFSGWEPYWKTNKEKKNPKPKNQQLSFGTHKQLHIFELVCFVWGWWDLHTERQALRNCWERNKLCLSALTRWHGM